MDKYSCVLKCTNSLKWAPAAVGHWEWTCMTLLLHTLAPQRTSYIYLCSHWSQKLYNILSFQREFSTWKHKTVSTPLSFTAGAEGTSVWKENEGESCVKTTAQDAQAHRLDHLVSAGKLQTALWALQTSAFPLHLVDSFLYLGQNWVVLLMHTTLVLLILPWRFSIWRFLSAKWKMER